jgi:TM2 domain-containing membrane protein YozV
MDELNALAAANQGWSGSGYPNQGAYPSAPSQDQRSWTVHDQGQDFGPYSEQDIASYLSAGSISQQAVCWREGMPQWIPITQVVPLAQQHYQPAYGYPAQQVYAQPAYAQPQVQIINHVVHQPFYAPVYQQPRHPQWNAGVAALLSFLIPGLGQMYKGQPINGIVWFIFVIFGYALFVVPGLILHLICIIGAASGDPYRR